MESSTHHTIAEEIQAILAALVGGARYGFKIRVPHALVMTVLFRRDLSNEQKIRSVAKLALEHASNLAAFAAIYKVGAEEFFHGCSTISTFLTVISLPDGFGVVQTSFEVLAISSHGLEDDRADPSGNDRYVVTYIVYC